MWKWNIQPWGYHLFWDCKQALRCLLGKLAIVGTLSMTAAPLCVAILSHPMTSIFLTTPLPVMWLFDQPFIPSAICSYTGIKPFNHINSLYSLFRIRMESIYGKHVCLWKKGNVPRPSYCIIKGKVWKTQVAELVGKGKGGGRPPNLQTVLANFLLTQSRDNLVKINLWPKNSCNDPSHATNKQVWNISRH